LPSSIAVQQDGVRIACDRHPLKRNCVRHRSCASKRRAQALRRGAAKNRIGASDVIHARICIRGRLSGDSAAQLPRGVALSPPDELSYGGTNKAGPTLFVARSIHGGRQKNPQRG
jgi:hypothetical protein